MVDPSLQWTKRAKHFKFRARTPHIAMDQNFERRGQVMRLSPKRPPMKKIFSPIDVTTPLPSIELEWVMCKYPNVNHNVDTCLTCKMIQELSVSNISRPIVSTHPSWCTFQLEPPDLTRQRGGVSLFDIYHTVSTNRWIETQIGESQALAQAQSSENRKLPGC